MSKVEEGNLFFKRFTRVALALSVVTSSLVLADQTITVDSTDLSNNILRGEDKRVIVHEADANGGAFAIDDISVEGAIVAGKTTSSTSDGTTTTTYEDGHNSGGSATGVHIGNDFDSVTNLGTVSATASTIRTYDPSSAVANDDQYPDINETELNATAIDVAADITGLFSNQKNISATVDLYNDTNKSKADAVGVYVRATHSIGKGFTNTATGNISATATKHADNGGAVQERVGGTTGKATINEDDSISDKNIITAAATGETKNELSAAGVRVEGTITGGLSNHGYISSVVNESTGTIIGSTTEGSTYKENGLTVTPNTGAAVGVADDSGVDDTGTELTDTEIATKVSDGINDGTDAVATATDNTGKKDDTAVASDVETVKNAVEADNAGATESPADGVVDGQIATERANADAEDADYQRAPTAAEIETAITDQKAAQTAGTSTPPDAATAGAKAEGIKSDIFTARIGDVHNYGAITGVAGGNGVEVRATTSSELSDLEADGKLDLTHTEDANGAITSEDNANITSGTASAYLGEGSSPIVSQTATGDITNDLIGGLFNANAITGGAGKAGISLNADSSVDVSSIKGIHLTVDRNDLDINVAPSSIVAVGQLYNFAGATITAGDGSSGIEMLADGSSAVKTTDDANITGGILRVTPTTINTVGTLGNAGTITGKDGASGITMSATSDAKIDTGAGAIENAADIKVTPLVTNRIDTLINTNTIEGGMGGSGIAGSATATATIKSKDINESSNIEVAPIVNSTVGDFFNYGKTIANIKASLGVNAVALTSTGTAELVTDKIDDATVSIHSQSTGGVRIKGNTDSTGSFYNGGELSVALSADAVTLDATGTAKIDTATGGASNIATIFNHSTITVKDTTIAGTEGNFANIYHQDDDGTKSVHRGTIKASLASDALTLEATGKTILTVKEINGSTVHFEQNTLSGVGGDFVNGNEIKVALAANGVDLSSSSTTTAHDAVNTEINASAVTTITRTKAGVGGNFVNGAFALDIGRDIHDGAGEANTTLVYNPATRPTGNVIAAEIDDTDTSSNKDRISTSTQNNPILVASTEAHFYDKEASIITATIEAALAADAVKFVSTATGDLKAKSIVAGTTEYDESDGTTYRTMNSSESSIVKSYTESNSSIGGDFVNNAHIKVALAANGVDGASEGKGTLGDITTSTVRSSTATQVTLADGGVKGDFKNEVISSEVGDGRLATELSGSTEGAKVFYNRATNSGAVIIESSLAADAIKLTSDSTNNLTLLASDAAEAMTVSNTNTLSTRLSAAQATRSTVESSTYAISGVEKDFSNTGVIKVSLAASGLDATATGTNNIGAATTAIGGSVVTANMKSIAGIRGDFTNDVHSLDTGTATPLYMDVQNTDGTPRYYINDDDKEAQRVKSNVLDTDAIVIGDNGQVIDTDGIVYNRELEKGEITAALAANPIKLDGKATVNFVPLSLGVTAVDTVALNTNGTDIVDNSAIAIKTTSSLNSENEIIAGIGGRFTNKNLIKTALAAEALTATGTATNNFGATTTTVEGADVTLSTVVKSGIGNYGEHNGFVNLANTYDTGDIETDTSKIKANTINPTTTLIKSDANNDVAVGTPDLPLIDSATVAFWNKEKVVGTMSSSLAKEVVKVEGKASSTITPLAIKSASTTVTLSDGSSVAVEDYLVTGNSKVDVDVSAITYAGINGGFTNQGAMTSSLALQVLNAKGTAEGNIGSAVTDITGAELVKNSTIVVAGIQGGGFKNEAISLDVANGDVGTAMSATGIESPTLYFDKITTKADTVMSATLAKEVLLLDATATNIIDAKSIVAFGAVQDTTADNQTDANRAKSTVEGITTATGGIAGNFYNNAKLDATLSSHVITSVAKSDNDLGVSGESITGSIVTATASSDTQIKGAFINDTVLLDTGAATEKYRLTTEGDPSNVIHSITYAQEINEGKIKASLSKDVLRLIAEGTNNIKLSEVGNTAVKVVSTSTTTGYIGANAAFTERNVSSVITANNTAKSGIGGSFVNAGTMESSLSKVVLNFQAIGDESTVEIAKISGGTVDATNTVISGINLNNSATNTIAFLNDKRDFNTVLETDATYDTAKVITGTIKSATGKEVINLVAEGGAKTIVVPDAAGMDTADGVDSPFEIARINNRGDNSVIINGHFVNRGTIEAATAPHALILSSTNSVINNVGAGIVNDGAGNKDGMVSSIAMADVNTSINGTLDNSGLIKTDTGTSVISLISDGGSSTIVSTASDIEGIEYASASGIEIAKNISTTESSIGGLRNTGTIEGAAGAKAIVLDADGIADSITGLATLPDTTATNNVFINRLTSTAKIGDIYNSGSIKTADATVIDLTANGGAKVIAQTVAQENIEDTTAVVIASVGDITNDAYTEQNIRRDVNKYFNGGHQLLPNEGNVSANRGEYDFATFGTTDTNGNTNYGATVASNDTQHDTYNYSSGTKIVSDPNAYSLDANLTALAYEDGNSSKSPALSQTIGEIKTATGAAAISLVAIATDSNTTTVKATAGNILNRGLINGGTGKGIFLSSTGVLQASGDHTTGAKAYATAGYIHNQVIDNTFAGVDASNNPITIHAILEGNIKGDAGAIVLAATVGNPAVDQDKQDVSITTVDTIVNNRLVLDKGTVVLSSDDGATADGKVKASASDFATVTSIATNYSTKELDKDTVFNAVIGSGADKVAIDIGQHAHVTNGIHNFGIIKGQVKLGDADLYLYGLVEDNASQLKGASAATNHIMTQKEFEGGLFEQRAGIVDAIAGITNAYAGSSITMTGTHLLKAATSPVWNADEIIISSEGVVNVQKDATFNVMNATDIYNRGLSGKFKNQGILNIAANQGANITGTYEQTGKLYINVKSDVFTPQADEEYAKDGSAHGQLNVTGEANFGNSEIKIVFDEGRTDAELLEIAQHTDETRISDVIVASVGINGTGGTRTAEETTEQDTLTGLNITTNRSSIGMRTMQGSANGHVDLAFYYVPPTPASTGTPTGGGSAAVQTIVSRDFSEIISSRLEEIHSPLTPTGSIGGRIGNTFVGGSGVATPSGENPEVTQGSNAVLSESSQAMPYSELSASDSERDAAIEGLALGTIDAGIGGASGSQASAWIKPFVGWSKQDGSKNSNDAEADTLNENGRLSKAGNDADVNTGYSATTYGLAAGIDKMYKGWRVGTAIAATSSNLDGESNSNYKDEMKGVQITEYGSKKLESGYVNLQVGLGYMKHDAQRITTDAAAEKVTSEFDGYVFQAKAGYEAPLEALKNDKLTVLAYGDANYIHVANKAYEEEGSAAAFKVDDIDTDALIFGGGLKANYEVGSKSSIYGHAGVGYDVIGDEVDTDVTPVFGGDSVRVSGEKPEQFEYNLGLGYQTTLNSGLNIRAGVDYKGRDGYQSNTASVRFTLPF